MVVTESDMEVTVVDMEVMAVVMAVMVDTVARDLPMLNLKLMPCFLAVVMVDTGMVVMGVVVMEVMAVVMAVDMDMESKLVRFGL
jgi:hypothetical protein